MGKDKQHLLHNVPFRTEQEMNYLSMMENMAMKYFAIFEEDMTQTIYENYLGILGVMEIQVASKPKANWVIPLIEKGIFPRKIILGFGPKWKWQGLGMEMGMTSHSGKKEEVIFFSFQTTKPRKKRTQAKISENQKKKKGPKIKL